jgi:hypothetical protein
MGDGTHALVFSVVAEGGVGLTQYEEDTPSASGDLGTMPLAVRNDAGGSLVSANGDYAPLQVNAAGQLVIAGGAGGTSMADDAAFAPGATQITPAGAMHDDIAPDSVDEGDAGVVRMSANRNLYVRIRDDAGNERGLNVDAAGAIAVTNAALAVVGGGAEATAQRVTLANDGTGLLSVDDNGGSLTVDQATHDNLQCNANVQVGDADVAVGNPVPVAGSAAEDAACAGNPILVGGRYHASVVAADAVDDGDAVRLLTDNVGGVVRGHRADAWNANANYAAAQTDAIVKAAPGANLALYVTDILFSTDTAMNIFLEAAAAIITPKVYLAANGGWSAHFQTPVRWTTNTAITITSSAAGNHSVLILGYTAP